MCNIDESAKVTIDLGKLKSRLQRLEDFVKFLKKSLLIDDNEKDESANESSQTQLEKDLNDRLKELEKYKQMLEDYTKLYEKIDEFFRKHTTNGKIHKGHEGEYNALQEEFDLKNPDLKKVVEYIEKSGNPL